VGKAPARRVYRQDVPGSNTAGPRPPRRDETPPPAAQSGPTHDRAAKGATKGATKGAVNGTKGSAKGAQGSKAPDAQHKVTLILHPAPQSAPQRRRKKDSRPKTAREALRAKAAKRSRGGKDSTRSAPRREPEATTTAPELEAAWIAADAAQAVESAQAAGPAVDDLVKAWLSAQNTAALARVAASDTLTSATRKTARRALHILKSRGVDIPRVETASPVATAPEQPVCVATFVPADSTGVSFLSFTQRQPSGRYQVADLMVSYELGIVHASSGRIAGKHIRRWRNRVVERFGMAPVEVPLQWARYRVAMARKQNDESHHWVPLGFENCTSLLTPTPDSAPPHPIADLEASLNDKLTEAARADSGKLHNDPEFRPWMPAKAAMDELLVRLGERIGSGSEDDAGKVEAAVREETAAATDRYFTPETRSILADRMRDSAISVRKRSNDESASRVLAAARAVREAGLITAPPRDIAFLSAFFDKAIALMLHYGGGKLTVPVPQKHPASDAG